MGFETSQHVRRVKEGDQTSFKWVYEKFFPLLCVQAEYYLSELPSLRDFYDPEDIAQDAWVVAWPKLPDLSVRDGRATPVVVKFLSSTLAYRFGDLVKKHIRGKPPRLHETNEMDLDGVLAQLPDRAPSAATTLAQHEAHSAVMSVVMKATRELGEDDYGLLVNRGLLQLSYHEIAAITGRTEGALRIQYGRVMKELRALLPQSLFAELLEE